MGCTSSSLPFRETYVELQKRWHLCSESYTAAEETSVNERSRLFVSCATNRSRNASHSLLVRGKCVFECNPLLVEQCHLLDPPFAEEGKENALHPYTSVLYHRLLMAVPSEHAYHDQREEAESLCVTHFLARWDYRIWMITCCEFFHVLAVFQTSKALPKVLKKFMNSLPHQLKSDRGAAQTALREDRDYGPQYELIARVWKEGAAALITAEMLTPKVLGMLKTELPSVFSGTEPPDGQDSSLTAKRLITLAREYEVRLEKVMTGHGGNPFYVPGGSKSPEYPSFLAFVEWIALQCALSVCGPEEDFGSYGVVQIEYSEAMPKCQSDAMDLWRRQLHRLETVEQQLVKLEPLRNRSESLSSLQTEKKAIEAEIEKFFACWCESHSFLTADEAAEKCFEMLDIRRTLPDRSVHEVLSSKAFGTAIRGSGTDIIDTTGKFRQYLKAYIALYDLYRDVPLQQLDASRKDGTYDTSCVPDHVNFESFRGALWNAHLRHDMEHDPLMAAAGDGKGVLNTDEVAEVFQQPFNMGSTEGSDDGTKGFTLDAVCTTVAEDFVPVGETLVLRLPIEQLGIAIGLADANCQTRFVASFLNEVFTLSDNRLSNYGATLAAEALETTVKLPRYIDYSAAVGVMAIHFACLSPPHWGLFAMKTPPSSDLLAKWLYRIRYESADRLSLDDHMNCHFFVHAFFSIAATQRAFEDTMPREAEGRPSDPSNAEAGKRKVDASQEYKVTKSHFVRAVASMCKYLDCSAETLLRNCSILLTQQKYNNSGGNSDAGAPQDSNFKVEDTFSSFCKAYGQLKGTDEAESEREESVSTEPTISIQHVLFVVASNFTRLHCAAYWRANNVFDLNEEVAVDVNAEPVPKLKAEKEVLALSNAMPLRSMKVTYCEFAELTKSFVNGEDNNSEVDAEVAFQQFFLHAFYEHYKPFFIHLELDENSVAEIGRLAIRYIVRKPNRGDNAAILTCNDYSGFLQFVLGHVMMQKAYEGVVRDPVAEAELESNTEQKEEGAFLSDRDLRRMLTCFANLTEGGAGNVPPAEDARAWLLWSGIDGGDEGLLSLEHAFLWYSAHRAESYALKSLFSWWKEKMAPLVPFSVSTTHRFARLANMREILRIKQHRENLPDDEPVELAEDEDGYLPIGLISYVLNERMRLNEVTLRLFFIVEQENITEGEAAGGDGAETHDSDDAFRVAAWVRSCVRRLNVVVHRSDLESREVHYSDFRFLLQYLHHFVSAYVGFYHTLTVLEVSHQGGSSEKDLDQIIGVSNEDRARLVDTFRQTVLPLLLPSGTAPAEMTRVFDTLLSKAWEEMRTKSVVMDSTCQEVAHSIAELFVRHSHEISACARHSDLVNRESQALQMTFLTDRAFIGALGGYAACAKLKYWERLRLLLPFGLSLQQRERRREFYLRMDRRQRGYLTISDLAGGLTDLVQLQSFRADFIPALLRAFMAAKKMSDEHEGVVYLTQKSEEQVLLPGELNAFLTYLYRYLELYFMFDVLTCGGYVHPQTLHAVPKQQSYSANDDEEEEELENPLKSAYSLSNTSSLTASDQATSAIVGGFAPAAAPRSGAAALLEAAKNPYQITLEAASMKKEITLAQFRIGRQLLRKWGAHIKNPDEVFYKVNHRRREADTMTFVGFAIWASEHDLHPEGYGYGYDDAVDAITTEVKYASL